MEKIKGLSIIVTGGTGFIGSHLVKKLIESEADVIVPFVDIPTKSYFKVQNLEKSVLTVELDITDKNSIFRLVKMTKPDFVIHLAAETIVEQAYEKPLETLQTNIMGTANILEAVRLFGIKKSLIVASSDKAYGKTNVSYKETHALKGDHPYDVSKSSADLIAHMYYVTYGLPLSITRSCNVYGQGDLHLNRIIPGICESVSRDIQLQIRSDGKYIRDYIYVDDLVNAYVFLIKNYKKTLGQAYNISSNETLSVIDLIKRTEKSLGKKIDYKINNRANNEIPFQKMNSRKIHNLGWKSTFSFDNVISDVYNWYNTFRPWTS